MGLLTVTGLTVAFGDRYILDDLCMQVNPGDRTGVVGRNGTGKTTLFRVLSGELRPESGEVVLAKNVRVGYLPQDVQEAVSGNLLRSVIDSVPGRVELATELAQAEASLRDVHTEEEQLKFSTRVARLHDRITELDMHYPEHEAAVILAGLGFKTAELERPLATLSGGWKMRAVLARLLYQQPDVLLLDEPTNHLDMPSVHWLEGFLRDYPGAILLVCHDREFLDQQISKVIAFEIEGVRQYNGNYDHYLKTREMEQETFENRQRNQEKVVKQAERFVNRFRAQASKARQVQSRLKVLRKLEMVETYKPQKTIRFSFPPAERSGRDVLTIQEVSKAYGEKRLYRKLTIAVHRGDRVAIVGPNGSGKTTLLRIVAAELKADEGSIHFGTNIKMSYFAQHHSDMLVSSNTVIGEVQRAVPNETNSYVRGVCGAFLFCADDVDKPVGVLSGGERARVALARCLVQRSNFMVMDEPTNHLDLQSSEVLIKALRDYDGTLLFVSHNQSFVDQLATRIWDLREGELIEYPGNLKEYYEHEDRRLREAEAKERRGGAAAQQHVQQQAQPQAQRTAAPAAGADVDGDGDGRAGETAEDRAARKTRKRDEAERRQKAYHLLKPMKAELEPLEARIAVLEAREKELSAQMADPDVFDGKETGKQVFQEYGEVRRKLAELMARWEHLQEKMDKKKAELGL